MEPDQFNLVFSAVCFFISVGGAIVSGFFCIRMLKDAREEEKKEKERELSASALQQRFAPCAGHVPPQLQQHEPRHHASLVPPDVLPRPSSSPSSSQGTGTRKHRRKRQRRKPQTLSR